MFILSSITTFLSRNEWITTSIHLTLPFWLAGEYYNSIHMDDSFFAFFAHFRAFFDCLADWGASTHVPFKIKTACWEAWKGPKDFCFKYRFSQIFKNNIVQGKNLMFRFWNIEFDSRLSFSFCLQQLMQHILSIKLFWDHWYSQRVRNALKEKYKNSIGV